MAGSASFFAGCIAAGGIVVAGVAGGCGGGSGDSGKTANGGGGAAAHASGSGASSAGGGSTGPHMSTGAATGGGGGGGAIGDVGVWQDGPGQCPGGMPKKDITTSAELASASRGDDAYQGDAPATCYFVHDGSYSQDPVIFYALKGGEPGGARRVFVGESRDGVVIHGRGTIEDGTSDVTVSNMTFDLTGYQDSGAFNTMTLGDGKNITIDHVTFTGDCMTGLQGGHIETNKTEGVLVEACLIEKFGHCNGGGHEDHGVYLGAGKGITLRNNVIRGNSSRGIQMYTQGGEYGTLDGITVENNLIDSNGHADYEDGIVINSYGTGPITNVTIQRNILLKNYYSGIRFAGGTESGVVRDNTFVQNGAGSTSASRSEINVDASGGNANTGIDGNIFDVGNLLINDCYVGASHGFTLGGDFVHGATPSGAKSNCVGTEHLGDPMFADPAGGDYHPTNPAAKAYGAYAP
jgi:Right handed beta helix region